MHAWVREGKNGLEHCTTEVPLGSEPKRPAGKGWRRNYSLTLSKVTGAGNSPARRIGGKA